MSAEVTVLQERLLAQEDAQLRLSNQLTLLHDQNQQLRTTVVALEAQEARGIWPETVCQPDGTSEVVVTGFRTTPSVVST